MESASRMVTGFAEYRKPSGSHQLIALVGADPEAGSRFPVPQVAGARGVLEPDAVLVDQSGAALLDVDAVPVEAEINGRRARVLGTIRGFSSFLGSPYVFAAYQDGARYLGLGPEKATYILLRLRKGFAGPGVKRTLQTRLPHVDIWTREEFARRSQTYWLAQTGAGAGILTAAILGFLIGLWLVSQNHLRDYHGEPGRVCHFEGSGRVAMVHDTGGTLCRLLFSPWWGAPLVWLPPYPWWRRHKA